MLHVRLGVIVIDRAATDVVTGTRILAALRRRDNIPAPSHLF